MAGKIKRFHNVNKNHLKEAAAQTKSILGRFTLFVLIGLAVISGFAQASDDLTFKGCSIIRRAFMSEAARGYEEATGVKIVVTGGGATLGIRAAAAGDTDIGGSCRPCLPDWFDEEKGVYMTQIAWDALTFITHLSNPIDNISLEDAKRILTGKITNWKEVGGPDRRIICVFRSQVPEHGGKVSGVGYMARTMIFKDPQISFTDNALFFRNSAAVEEKIETLPFTFGVTGISSARKRNLKILKLEGQAPTRENIASGDYPLFRPLYLMTKGKPAGQIKDFIDWLLSDAGQRLVSEQGTVTLKEGRHLKEKFEFWQNTDLITNYPISY